MTNKSQSLVHNTTNIELFSQPNLNQNELSNSSLQRSNTEPLSSNINQNIIKISTPQTHHDSINVVKKKTLCTEAEIEQKRLAALAIRRQREQEHKLPQKK